MLSLIRKTLYDASKPKFLMKDDKAYTEDGLLIFNIFFKSKKMTKKEVRDYFTYFGEVKSVSLLRSPCKPRGFVTFEDASSAAKALQTFDGTQTERPVYVEAAESWNQPNGSKQCSPDDCYTSANPSCSADHNHLNILLLPDYCLEEICRNLNLSAQIHFARVCPRFHDVFQMYSKRAYRTFDCHMMNSMTEFEATYFIRYVGVHIETLELQFVLLPRKIAMLICNFCVNVKCLSVIDCELPRLLLQKLLRNTKNLQELNLSYECNLRALEALPRIPSLEIINLTAVVITGEMKIIKNMPQLVGLTLRNCYSLEVSDLVDILKSLRRFKFLDIRGSIFEDEYLELLNAIHDYGTELIVLKMDYYDSISYARLAQLPNLKYLQFYNKSEHLFDEIDGTQLLTLLEQLVFYKSNQLENLEIPYTNNLAKECIEAISQLKELKGLDLADSEIVNDDALRKLCNLKELQNIAVNSPIITNKGVLELLYNCKNLRYVNMKDCCNIDTDFIAEAIKILEERRDKLRKPVVFYVYGTSISETALLDMPGYKAAAEVGLIEVDFDWRLYKYDLNEA